MATRKYIRRSLQERKHILEKYDRLPQMPLNAAARLLNVSAPLLSIWLRKRNMKNAKSDLSGAVYLSCKTHQLEAALWRWIDASFADGITVNEPMIRGKAIRVAEEMGLSNFRANSAWLKRFKSREPVIREMFQVDQKEGNAAGDPKSADKVTESQKNLGARKTHRLEAALWRWIDHTQQSGVDLNESTIRSKAAQLAKIVGYGNFRANAEWFTRFLNREGHIRSMFKIGKNNQDKKSMGKLEPRMNFTNANMQQLEDALWRWIDHCRENNVTVNDSVICSEASRLARMMGFINFQSNEDWLKCFKARGRVVQRVTNPNPCPENPPNDQTKEESASYRMQTDESSTADQSYSESDVLSDLDIPKLEPTVVTAELNGNAHSVTVPSLWQMKEAMKTLATGLLYRGFCDFKLLHRFEKEVDNVLRRSVTLGKNNSLQA